MMNSEISNRHVPREYFHFICSGHVGTDYIITTENNTRGDRLQEGEHSLAGSDLVPPHSQWHDLRSQIPSLCVDIV